MTTIPPASLTGKRLYRVGIQAERREHARKETKKAGTLRGGTAGCVTTESIVFGQCHRVALARLEGLEVEPDDTSQVWFDAGYANESAWIAKLELALAQPEYAEYTLKSEEECAVKWTTSYNIDVTGRPDLMVYKGEMPIVGFELKGINAVKAGARIWCEDKPKTDNLIQAAHYMLKTGCPFTLVYSYRGRSIVPKRFNKYADKLVLSNSKSAHTPTGKPKKGLEYSLEPFTKEFLLEFEEGRLYYVREDGTKVKTPITEQGIDQWYELIPYMKENKTLFVRLGAYDLECNRLYYDPCKWCDFYEACEVFENNYDSWMDKVKLICEESKV